MTNIKGALMELIGTFALCYIGGMSISDKKNHIYNIALSHG